MFGLSLFKPTCIPPPPTATWAKIHSWGGSLSLLHTVTTICCRLEQEARFGLQRLDRAAASQREAGLGEVKKKKRGAHQANTATVTKHKRDFLQHCHGGYTFMNTMRWTVQGDHNKIPKSSYEPTRCVNKHGICRFIKENCHNMLWEFGL